MSQRAKPARIVAGLDIGSSKVCCFVAELDSFHNPRLIGYGQHVANGMQNKVVAIELGISEETVKSHISSIMQKLESASRTEAVAAGLRRALID